MSRRPRQCWSRSARRSIGDARQRAQLPGRGGGAAEEFQIGGDLLEQHVQTRLRPAAARLSGGENGRGLLLHRHLADEHVARQGAFRARLDGVAGGRDLDGGGETSSSSGTTATLYGMVISAPRMLPVANSGRNRAAKSGGLTPKGT